MKRRVAGGLLGIVFGIVLSWSGMTSPVVIRRALLFQQAYLFLFMASAVGTAALGLWLLRRHERRALLADTQLTWPRDRVAARHIKGALIFGLGWGIADACPGPVATQVGQGIAWGLLTLAGITVGIYVFLRRGHRETEPAAQPVPLPAPRVSAAA